MIRHLLTLLLCAALAAMAAGAIWVNRPLDLRTPTVELSVEPGTAPREVAVAWVQAGIATEPWLLKLWFRLSGQARWIRAGSYEVESGVTPRSLLAKMVRGDETLMNVRLIEGWTFRQWRAELARAPGLKPTLQTASDAELMAAIGQPGQHPEGRFFPDTYAYSRGASDKLVLQRAHAAMQRQLAAAWSQRRADSPLRTPDEALTLASIVEKETGSAADRALVAGVFVNRLRLGMPLQTDPTVIYGLGEAFDGDLRRRDLQADTPYNTYLHPGLPPSPIAMPGRASLSAAVAPAPTKALYFVARGDGTSVFSDDLAAHNRAVDRYQRGR